MNLLNVNFQIVNNIDSIIDMLRDNKQYNEDKKKIICYTNNCKNLEYKYGLCCVHFKSLFTLSNIVINDCIDILFSINPIEHVYYFIYYKRKFNLLFDNIVLKKNTINIFLNKILCKNESMNDKLKNICDTFYTVKYKNEKELIQKRMIDIYINSNDIKFDDYILNKDDTIYIDDEDCRILMYLHDKINILSKKMSTNSKIMCFFNKNYTFTRESYRHYFGFLSNILPSKHECYIGDYLSRYMIINHNLLGFTREMSFDNNYSIGTYKYDYFGLYRLKQNIIIPFVIEYDGIYHYSSDKRKGIDAREVVRRDLLKEIYLWRHGISLLRLSGSFELDIKINEFFKCLEQSKRPFFSLLNVEYYYQKRIKMIT